MGSSPVRVTSKRAHLKVCSFAVPAREVRRTHRVRKTLAFSLSVAKAPVRVTIACAMSFLLCPHGKFDEPIGSGKMRASIREDFSLPRLHEVETASCPLSQALIMLGRGELSERR